LRCAIYTRKSTEEGLDQEFNSLDAQREAAEAFIQSQRREPVPRSTCTSLIQAPSTYVRGYPSKEERDKRLKAVRDDPDFAEVVTKQEAHLARAREYNMERDFEM